MSRTADAPTGAADAPAGAASPAGRWRRWRAWRTEALLVGVVLLLAAPPAPNYRAQEASRYALTAALWDRHTVRLDGYVHFSDFAVRDGHVYSDKAPGQSLLAVPAYAAWRALGGHPATQVRVHGDVGVWLVTLWCVGLPAAALALLAHRAARRVDEKAALPVALALVAGTMLLPFSTVLFGHVLAGALAFAAFFLLSSPGGPRAPLGAGLLAGAAVAVEYPSAVVAVVLGAYLLARAPRSLPRYAAGLVPWALVVAAYHTLAFGGPFEVPYRFHGTFAAAHRQGFFGIGPPRLHQAVDVLVGQRGLLRLTPVVAVAAFGGLVLLARRLRWRAEAAVVAAVVGAFALIPAGLANEATDFAPGPRAVVPALAFLALPLAAAWARWPKVTAAAAAVGVVTMALAAYSEPLLRPDVDGLSTWAGRAFDRPAMLGLPGRSAPWVALAALVAVRLWVVSRRRPGVVGRLRPGVVGRLRLGVVGRLRLRDEVAANP